MNIKHQESGYYQTNDGHKLYWTRHGNPAGEPIFFLHGGPGGYCSQQHLAFFKLEQFDIVLFDQRGCGQSLPQGSITHNTTDLLVQDIESLRQYFGFPRISLLGVSWGSWLALKYQHRFQQFVYRCIAASVFVPFEACFNRHDQQLHQTLQHWPEPVSTVTVQQVYGWLCSPCIQQQRMAALGWSRAHLRSSMTAEQLGVFVDDAAIASIRLELHYHLQHYFFSPDDASLRVNAATTLVQGVFDTCGMHSLRWLQQRSHGASRLVRAGHNALEKPLLQTIKSVLAHA